jgi:hypothetical protein
MTEVGIVVPTLGTRLNFLRDCLQSVRLAGDAYIVVVAPGQFCINKEVDQTLFDLVVTDPNHGLPAAIDLGFQSMPKHISLISWLGDDDLLTPGSLKVASEFLNFNPSSVLVYGSCEYINENGDLLWLNRSGQFASYLLRFGPQLLPQPGSLFRRSAYESIGGLNKSLKWAFDLDLMIRLQEIGKLSFLKVTLSKFRWHKDSLSVGLRRGSVKEASKVRRSALPRALRLPSLLWETLLQVLILKTGSLLNRRSSVTSVQ